VSRSDPSPSESRRPAPLLTAQLVLFLGLVASIALAPPVSGPMLLVPLHVGPDASVAALNTALSHGASLLSAGPLPGSLVIRGERERVLPALLAGGTLVIAAAPLICGDLSLPEGDAA
jgi:hypothetical protein